MTRIVILQDLAATNMELCYIEDLFYVVMSSIPNALIYCCSDTSNFIRLSAHSALASAQSGTFFL